MKKFPDFFKVFLPAHSSEELCIPPAFLANLHGLGPGMIILRNCHGNLWHIKVEKIENDVFFRDGWPKFVHDNSVERGDFLVFRYDGNFVLDVVIYGKTGCEKEGTRAYVNAYKKTLHIKKEEEEEEGGVERVEEENNDDNNYYKEKTEEIAKTFYKKMPGTKRKDSGRGRKNIGTNNTNKGAAAVNVEGASKRTAPIKVEEDDASEAGTSVQPKNPSFVTKLKPGSKKSLYVPEGVIRDHNLKFHLNVILLDPYGRQWDGKVVKWRDGRTWISGWKDLCRANNVGINERCICEFMQGRAQKGNVIKVHIIRAGSEVTLPNSHAELQARRRLSM